MSSHPVPPVDPDRTSLVAFYGPKPSGLTDLIRRIQELASSTLAGRFRPRPLDDTHATVIGFEQHADRPREVAGLLGHVRQVLCARPLTVRFGGFEPSERRLLSRGRSLHERRLVVGGGQLILIGWPVGSCGDPTPALDDIRRECESFGLRHKYHVEPEDTDPDVYLVVGDVSGADVDGRELVRLAHSGPLASPTDVGLSERDLSVVQYEDVRLPRGSSTWWTLA
jgi:hypothetical protein